MKEKISFVLAILLCCACIGMTGCSYLDEKVTASKQIFAMDTYMKVDAYGKNAKEAVEAAEAEIHRLDELLSTGDTTSEVACLNRSGKGILSEDTKYLLQRSIEMYHDTDGVFDITIYPVMRLWGFTDQNFQVPDDKALSAALENVNASKIDFNEQDSSILTPPAVEIDFGGIAKGYTSQRVVDILRSYGIEHAMINLGGNIEVIGSKTDGSKWKIGVKDPKNTANYIGVISTSDMAVVTSGGYERFFEEEGIRYHHIIDPRTGYPANNGLASVTIVCQDGTLADGLSTSLFVMGVEDGIDFWRKHKDQFEFVFYTEDEKLMISDGLEKSFNSDQKYEVIH